MFRQLSIVAGVVLAYALLGPAQSQQPGMTLLRGLIDAHVHFILHPYNETPWDDHVRKESLALRVARGTAHARNTLLADLTAIRMHEECVGVDTRSPLHTRPLPGDSRSGQSPFGQCRFENLSLTDEDILKVSLPGCGATMSPLRHAYHSFH